MNDPRQYCIVLTTTATAEQAESLAKRIVTARLGACVQVSPIKSYYVWQQEARADAEFLLMVKTRTAQYADLESFIRTNHDYETPEIVQVPIAAGLPAYLSWIDGETGA